MSAQLPPALNIIAATTFAASLSGRALDPVLPHVAEEFAVSIATAAGFSAVFAFTFAVVQPVIGAAADMFGKARLMTMCLVLLGIANILGALSSTYSMLFFSRILAGVGSGGVFPVSMSLVADLVGPDKRQVALARTLAGAMAGNLLGASLSGLIGDLTGWRGVLGLLGVLAIGSSVMLGIGFRGAAMTRQPRASFAAIRQGYLTIFANPNAKFCYGTVFVEGCCVMGMFPYVASFLFELGETRLSIAGIVIAGASLVGLQLAAMAFGPEWRIQLFCLVLMGWGFYMIHGCIQVFASELSVEARATALSLHSFFFFLGQTCGPIAYGFGIAHAGKIPTLLVAALAMIALGFACAKLLRHRTPGDVASA